MEIVISRGMLPPPGKREVEIVERKGLGHPDSICDALAEELCLELCRHYVEQTGQVLHHNVDKALLAAGASEPTFGGGRVTEPIQIILAGRAVLEVDGRAIDIHEIADDVVRGWIRENLHCVDPRRGVAVSTAVRAGSAELVGLFEQSAVRSPMANDSSCGVGFAPLSEVEQLVLAIESRLNSRQTRVDDPALGEDVKVMAFRRGDAIQVVLACAMIDGALSGIADYVAAKQRAAEIAFEAARKVTQLPLRIDVNTGDDIGAERVYLTVTGTSAEAGDDGQAGRGNRVNGLITPCRPMTIESVAGKNPVTHVGKVYNLAAGLIADRIVTDLPDVESAECRMVSAIGRPIDEPRMLEVRVDSRIAAEDPDLEREVSRIVREELAQLSDYPDQLQSRILRLDRWPLRS